VEVPKLWHAESTVLLPFRAVERCVEKEFAQPEQLLAGDLRH